MLLMLLIDVVDVVVIDSFDVVAVRMMFLSCTDTVFRQQTLQLLAKAMKWLLM